MIPEAWHIQTEHEVEDAYQRGRMDERERIAAATIELDIIWRNHGVIGYLDRVRARIALMEERALASTSTWRGFYPGGPVDFETGALLADKLVAA